MANAAQRKDIRRAEKDAATAEQLRIDFIHAAMSTKQGRAWFHDLLVACHIFSDPFSGNALVEAYSKGERNVGLKVYNDIVANCPNLFVTMMQEANEREIANDRRSQSEHDSDGTADGEYDGGEDGDGGNSGSVQDPIYGTA